MNRRRGFQRDEDPGSDGILTADIAPEAPIDPYKTDERYWRSLWHRP
ncbi:hypothetical protein [Haloferula sp. A504]|jgi:hypothetical protein|nr:hypothetical protein [Verrucomicrobiaceae bacterium E54]